MYSIASANYVVVVVVRRRDETGKEAQEDIEEKCSKVLDKGEG